MNLENITKHLEAHEKYKKQRRDDARQKYTEAINGLNIIANYTRFRQTDAVFFQELRTRAREIYEIKLSSIETEQPKPQIII